MADLRIGIDARSLLEAHPSGVSQYTQALLLALAQLPERTATLCLFTAGRKVDTQRVEALLKYSKIEWQHLGWPNKLLHLATLLGLAPKIEQILNSVDVMFLPNWHFFPHHSTVPYVLTIHDCTTQLYPQLLSRKRKLWHQLLGQRRLVANAKQLITVSKTTQQDVEKSFGVSSRRITTIWSGAPQPIELQSVPNLPERYVLALGTLEPRKNSQTLLQAMQTVREQDPDLQLVMVGDRGWQSISGEHYIGYRNEAEKWYLLEHAQALVYPSLYEGFGFPPLEAFQVGTPVIASFTGALPEICGDAALYVNPYSSSDLATAITTLVHDTTLREQLITAGKQRVKQFNWNKTAQHTLQVLEQAVY